MMHYETIVPFDERAKVETQNLAEAVLEKLMTRGNSNALIVREDTVQVNKGFFSTTTKHKMRLIVQGTDKEAVLRSFPLINEIADTKGRPVDHFVYTLRTALKPLKSNAELTLVTNPDEKLRVVSEYLDDVLKDYKTSRAIELVNGPYVGLTYQDEHGIHYLGTLGHQHQRFFLRLNGPLDVVLAVRAAALSQNRCANKFDKISEKFSGYSLETYVDYDAIKMRANTCK